MWKKILKSKELKIFLIFFVLYSLFIQWYGWDENSRYFLTRAMVDEGTLSIDIFTNQTTDRIVFGNHYYSDKDPGTSLIASVPYSIFKFLYHENDQQENRLYLSNTVGKTEVYDVLNPDKFTLYSMIVVVMFTSVLFSSLTLVLIYKISGLYINQESKRLTVVFAAGLATAIFPYALVFTDNAIAGFFSLFGFYMLLKKKIELHNQKKYSFMSGISFGVAAITSIFTIIISVIAFGYLVSFKDKKKRYLILAVLGFLLSSSIYLTYNYFIFKNPIVWPHIFSDKNVFIYSGSGYLGILQPNSYIIWRLLFDPYKGVFFYYPIYILAIYGLYLMRKKMRAEMLFILSIFILNVIFNSTVEDGFGGGGFFGPRYLTYFVPFFAIPLTVVLEKNGRFISFLFAILCIISIIVNFAGIRPPSLEIMGPDRLTVADQFKSKVNSFDILTNPIIDYYLPQFFNSGPRSRILQTMFDCDYRIDIRQPLPVYAENCSKPIIAEGEAVIPVNKSLKLCACSQYAGGDGVIFDFVVDGFNNYIHIDSNKCKTSIVNVPLDGNQTHEIEIVPGVYGQCDQEGVLIRELSLIDKSNSTENNQSYEYFDLRSSFEVWNSSGNIRLAGNGTELGVGNCNSSSSIQKNILIPSDAQAFFIRSCADFAGGDGTVVKVSIDNERNIFEIQSNLCQENSLNIQKFADGKNHTIKIESEIKGRCGKEAPTITWIKITG